MAGRYDETALGGVTWSTWNDGTLLKRSWQDHCPNRFYFTSWEIFLV